MGDCYEHLFQFLTSQQSIANRLQQKELERLRRERDDLGGPAPFGRAVPSGIGSADLPPDDGLLRPGDK